MLDEKPGVGEQRPRVSSAPPGQLGTGEEIDDLVADCRLNLLPWQRHVLDVAMAERPDGRWAAPEVALVVPRQNGKGDILVAREIAGLFLLDEELIVHTAHEGPTAKDAHRRLKAALRRSPDLWAKTGFRDTNGDLWVWNTETGGRARFMTRTEDAGRGLTAADLIVYDEAYALTAEQEAALDFLSTVKANAQSWYTSSAGMVDSEILLGLRDRGHRGDDAFLAYMEFSADPRLPADDRRGWAQGNPSMGHLFGEDRVAREYAKHKGGPVFRRERLGAWPEEAKVEWVVDADTYLRLRDERSQAEGRVVFALDMNPERTWVAIGVAGRRSDGLLHAEVAEHRPHTAWAPPTLAAMVRKWDTAGPVQVARSSPAAALKPDLEDEGLEVELVGGPEEAAACGAFVDRTNEQAYRHLGQAPLTTALDGARKRPVGDGAFTWQRRDVSTDISPLYAVTLALQGFAKHAGDEQEVDIWL